jgi:ketosteroid isomerase-like protein
MTGVDLLREFWRTWDEKGGAGLVERYDEFFTEDAEWRPPMRELTAPRYAGREGVSQYVRDVGNVLTDLRTEIEEIEEIAPDVIRAKVHMRGHGRISGVTLDAPMIAIARLRDGRIDLAWASYDPEAAERAADAIVHGGKVPA